MEISKLVETFGFATLRVWGLNDEGKCLCGSTHETDNSAGKHPVGPNGHLSAEFAPELAAQWLDEGSNVGINCEKSGVVVLDIDPRNDGFNSLEKLLAPLPGVLPKTLTVITGSSNAEQDIQRGMHLYFRAPSGASFHSSFGKDYPGIDIKHNGYVIAPGSRHYSGHTYELANSDSQEEIIMADLPAFLLAIMSRSTSRGETESGVRDLAGLATELSAYGKTALDGESEAVRQSREGQRNQNLFDAGLRIGSLISGGHIPAEDALEALVMAAMEAGLDEGEAVRTLIRPTGQGALQLGASTPRGPENVPDELIQWAHRQTQGALVQSADFPSNFPEFLNAVDWLDAFTAEVEDDWLIPGFVATGRSHLLYSQPGLGKSLLTLEISARLASGREVLGRPSAEPIKVLYLDHENSIIGDVVPRLREMGFSHEDLSNLVYASFPDMETLDTDKGGNQLLQILDAVNPEFVVLDTVSRAIVGEENNNTTWLRFYKFAGQHLKSRSITFVRLDHVGKDTGQGPRGGSAKTGDVDLVWRLSGTPGGSSFRLHCEKSRMVVPEGVLQLSRKTHPLLCHKLEDKVTGIDWAELVSAQVRLDAITQILESYINKNGALGGQKAVWDSVKRQVKAAGAAHNEYVLAHKMLKEKHEVEVET